MGKAMRRTERGFDRLVNFSDAVVAIAITLLVLPLTEIAGEVGKIPADELISENSNSIFAFMLSFVLVANYWLLHHRMFEYIGDYDNALAWLDIGWLFFIVTLPFSTELISEGFQDGAGLVYTFNLAAVSLFACFIAWRVQRVPDLQAQDYDLKAMRVRKSLIYGIFFVLVGLFSLVAPNQASTSLLLLIPIGFVLGRKDWE